MIELFKDILRCNQDELYMRVRDTLKLYGYKNIICDTQQTFVFGYGDIPIVLVAHLDTVFPGTRHFIDIYYDEKQEVMWSPDGLGADDRAGVLAITIMLQETKYRPHILFTTNEESDMRGACMASRLDIKPNFIIELDRQGYGESVYYQCANKEFEKYINSFGFTTCRGSYTDISVLCPVWECAGVNLSVGYYDEHSLIELWRKEDFLYTLDKLYNILSETPPKFKYEEEKIKV